MKKVVLGDSQLTTGFYSEWWSGIEMDMRYPGKAVAASWIYESKAWQKGHKHTDKRWNQGNSLDHVCSKVKNGATGTPTFR